MIRHDLIIDSQMFDYDKADVDSDDEIPVLYIPFLKIDKYQQQFNEIFYNVLQVTNAYLHPNSSLGLYIKFNKNERKIISATYILLIDDEYNIFFDVEDYVQLDPEDKELFCILEETEI